MSSDAAKNPPGGATTRHVMERQSLNPVTLAEVLERENLKKAWKQVRANKGAPGVDTITIEEFPEYAFRYWEGIKTALLEGTYQPAPVKRVEIPKDGGGTRPLGIPTVTDRVIQQAISQMLTPVFDPHFSNSSYGFRPNRSAHQAVHKVEKDIREGCRFAVDIDLEKFFGSVDHEKLLLLVRQRVSDGRVLGIIESMLKAGCFTDGETLPTEQGTPQGGIVSPLLSNILLTPFDWEMRRKGYRLTRYADDWVVTCKTQSEARAALAAAQRILEKIGVRLNVGKTRIVHVRRGFEFLGFLIRRGSTTRELSPKEVRSGVVAGKLYAYPRKKSIVKFKEQIRRLTRRNAPVSTEQVITDINPVIRGWGNYFCKSHVRRLFARLDGWIMQRIRAQKYKRWRNAGWRELPDRRLYQMGLVVLRSLIPSKAAAWQAVFVKAGCGKSARPV